LAGEQIIYNEDDREAMLRGVNFLADPFKATIGLTRRSRVVKVDLQDPYEDLGAQMVREVVSKAADAGGGATTATVLAQSIFSGAARAVSGGADPAAIQRGIEAACEIVLAEVRKRSQPVSERLMADVATLAAAGDRALGELVATAIRQAGQNGVISIEASRGTGTELHEASGFRFER
jgi:chaperonin GroEL